MERTLDWLKQRLELIKVLLGVVTAVLGTVIAVVQFLKLWRGDQATVTWVTASLGWLALVLLSGYVAWWRVPIDLVDFKGRPSKQRTRAYPERWCRFALAVFVLLLLAPAVAGYALYRHDQALGGKVVILVADFDGPEPGDYRVTKTVWEQMELALEKYDDVQLERLERTFDTSSDARVEGKRRKASIVIWGWYGATEEVIPLSVHFEVLRPPKYMPELGPEIRGQVQTMAVAELESFTLQTNLSAEMAYLSLFTVGMARYAAGDWDGAIARFTDALNQTAEPVPALDQSTVHFYRGTAYYSKDDYDHAIADYDQAIQLQPDNAKAYNNRGLAYAYKGDYDRAIADYDRAIQLRPDHAKAYNNRGLAYYDKGDYDRAIADYTQAIQVRPDDAGAYNNRGVAYAAKGYYDRAIADHDQAIQLRPEYAKAYYDRGVTYADKGDYDRAIADYTRAIQLRPDLAEAYYGRGLAYYDKGDYYSAIADYTQAIQVQPDYADAYYGRGLAYKSTGEKDEAIADFERVLELSTDPYWRQQAEQQLRELRETQP